MYPVVMTIFGGSRHWAGAGAGRDRHHHGALQPRERTRGLYRPRRHRAGPHPHHSAAAARRAAEPHRAAGAAITRAGSPCRRAEEPRRFAPRDAARTVLECRDVQKSFGGIQALSGVITCRAPRARSWASSAPTARANRPSSTSSPAISAIDAGAVLFEGAPIDDAAGASASRGSASPAPTRSRAPSITSPCSTTWRSRRSSARRGRIEPPHAAEAMHWLAYTGLAEQGIRPAAADQSARAQIPRARPRARGAAAPAAARRGDVGPQPHRDRRGAEAHPRHPRPRHDHHLRRASDARGGGAVRPGRGARTRARSSPSARRRRRCATPKSSASISATAHAT